MEHAAWGTGLSWFGLTPKKDMAGFSRQSSQFKITIHPKPLASQVLLRVRLLWPIEHHQMARRVTLVQPSVAMLNSIHCSNRLPS